MIITCPSCKKKFNINASLIPDEGRDLKCGSCSYVWFYDSKKDINNLPKIKENFSKEKVETTTLDNNYSKKIKKTQNNFGIKLLSYLIVFIISLISLIILLDTLKTPLISIFPRLEIFIFNLFETLKDIKLFIIDLS